MALYSVYASVLATIEFDGDLVEASSFIEDLFTADSRITKLQVPVNNLIQWTIPRTNEKVVTDDGRYRYTLSLNLSFVCEGGRPVAQKWIIGCLMTNEEQTRMNIQKLDTAVYELGADGNPA